MQGGEVGYADGEEVAAHVKAAALDNSAALQRAWCNAEHCLPLDDVVRREVWDGSIPIRLELAKQDVSTFEPPMPFYLQVLVTWFFCSCVCARLYLRGLKQDHMPTLRMHVAFLLHHPQASIFQ